MADDFVVNDNVFKVVDIVALASFIKKSGELADKFEELKKEFNRINGELVGKGDDSPWKGEGADEYKYETDHILEKIGDLKSTIEALNRDTLANIKQSFSDKDDEIGEQNRKLANDEE